MAKDKAIWVEGEKELFVNMQRSMDGSIKAAREGLQNAGLKIIADAVQNIRSNKIWNTGALANSGKVQKVEGDEDAIDAGFFSDKSEGYAAYVEYGRRAGKMPPWDMLAAWAQKKLRLNPKEAKSVGFLIARKIAKKRTRPHPFFAPAVKKNKKEVTRAIQNAVKDAKSVGFLIARKIAKKGIRPHPFFAPAVKKNEKEVTRAIQNAVKESIK